MSELVIVKPKFDEEIKANIKSFGEIESNMKEVKKYVEELNQYYKNVTFTEETMKEAKDEKSKVNKFKKIVSDYRKDITKKYNEPIEQFNNLSKETESLLTDTYNTINAQVANYENEQKAKKEKEVKEYFEEYKITKNIDFITYERANINVTLTASMKSLKEQAKQFIDNILNDLQLIETQGHKEEILVEFKQSLNVSNAIMVVTNRFKAIEEEKKRQEEKARKEEEVQEVVFQEKPKILEKPKNNNGFFAVPEKTEIILKIKVNLEEKQNLVRFLSISNIEYESEDL